MSLGSNRTDGWIIGSIVLWFLATGADESAGERIKAAGDDSVLTLPSSVVGAHWVRTLLVLALLVMMVHKPGA